MRKVRITSGGLTRNQTGWKNTRRITFKRHRFYLPRQLRGALFLRSLLVVLLLQAAIIVMIRWPPINIAKAGQTPFLHRSPTIISVAQTPRTVEYFHWVNVTTRITENGSAIAKVKLYLRADGGPWWAIPMASLGNSTYSGVIPRHPWNALVEYYINATDVDGHSTLADNNGSYYNYRVVDTIAPQVYIENLPRTARGMVYYDVKLIDPGSGIDHTDLFIDDQWKSTTFGSGGFGGNWDTTLESNGYHILNVTALDKAGNNASSVVVVLVDNPSTPPVLPIPGFPFEAIVLALVASIGVSLRRRRLQS